MDNRLVLLHDAAAQFRGRTLPDLDEIIEKAPDGVEYKPDSNGFYLSNEQLRFRYSARQAQGRWNTIDLWFLKPEIKVGVSGTGIDMDGLPESLSCDHLILHTGNTWSFHFPTDGRIGDTVQVFRNPTFDDRTGPKEWFDKGADLLKKAASKYHLGEWYKGWRADYSRLHR